MYSLQGYLKFDHNIPQFVEGTHQGSQNLSTQKAMAIRFRNLHPIQRFMIHQNHPYLSTIGIALQVPNFLKS
jgi:hypothetical protein